MSPASPLPHTAGDIQIVSAMVGNQSEVITPPTGCTQLQTAAGGYDAAFVFACTSSLVASPSFTISPATEWVAHFSEWCCTLGVGNTALTLVNTNVAPYTSSANPVTPSAINNALLFFAARNNQNSMVTPPVGYTQMNSPGAATTTTPYGMESFYLLNAGTVSQAPTAVWGTGYGGYQDVVGAYVVLNASASPAPSPSPTATPTASPSPSPSPTSSASPSNYVNIINSQEWPTNYLAFCQNATPSPGAPCPYNVILPSAPAHLMTQNGGSAAILAAMVAHGQLSVGMINNTTSGVNASSMPTYLAAVTDPSVTITCTSLCWNGSTVTSSYSMTIPHVPAYARALGAICPGDCQMQILDPTGGNAYSIYGMTAQYAGGSSISAYGFAETNIVTGNGVDPCYMSLTYPGAGGGCTANGGIIMAQDTLRLNEITNGIIPHALVVEMNYCTSSEVYPGNTGEDCAANYGYTGPPMGARFIVNLTDAQINGSTGNTLGYTAANAAAWEKVMLHQMRDYGLIAGPTCGGGCGGTSLMFFTQTEQIQASGGTTPWASFNFTSPAGGGGGTGTFPSPWTPGGLNLAAAASWLILDPCYSLENSTASGCTDLVN